MAKQIGLPDGSIGEFPDDMTDAAIEKVLARQFPGTPKSQTLEQGMAEQARSSIGTGLQTGIAKSATKTVRGIGTTLLPKSLEKWAEDKGWLPTKRDVDLLSAGTEGSGAAKTGEVIMDIGTEMLPFAKGMKGAKTTVEALFRAPAIGTSIGATRAEEGDVAKEAVLGGAGGLAGEAVGRGIGYGLSHLVPPSSATKFLLSRPPAQAGDQHIVPSLGAAADPNTLRGKVLNFFEGQMETMPFTGAPIRMAKKQSSEQLFREAADLGTVPGGTVPAGDRVNVIRDLSREAEHATQASLDATRMPMRAPQLNQINAYLDTNARGKVSPEVLDRIKAEVASKLTNLSPNGVLSADVVDNIARDLYKGIPATRNDTNAQQIVNGLASEIKSWTNKAAAQSGHPLAEQRQARANLYALERAGGVTPRGTSGERIVRGVDANDKSIGSADTATRELRDLGEAAQAVTEPRRPFSNRNWDQLGRDLWGTAKEGLLGVLTGGTGHAAGMTYGAFNATPAGRKLLLNDPVQRAAFLRALSPVSGAVGTQALEE